MVDFLYLLYYQLMPKVAHCDICKTATTELHSWEQKHTRRHKDKEYRYASRHYRCRKCSRERARAYYNTKNGNQRVREINRRSYLRYPEKNKARFAVRRA